MAQLNEISKTEQFQSLASDCGHVDYSYLSYNNFSNVMPLVEKGEYKFVKMTPELLQEVFNSKTATE